MSKAHTHASGTCPYADASGADAHGWCPAQAGDSRSPCPAVNTLANHGYLPRDGKGITADMAVAALMACYHISKPLAWALAHGTVSRLGQGKTFELHDLAAHNVVEHDASLCHADANGAKYAPTHVDAELLKDFFAASTDGRMMTPEDIARVRVRREALAPPLQLVQGEVARGEMSVVLNMFNNPDPTLHASGVPLQPRSAAVAFLLRLFGYHDTGASRGLNGVPVGRLRYWFENERLPPDWQPYHTTTLLQTVATMGQLRAAMAKVRHGEIGMKGKIE
ncbi:peroxidase family 2 protein [Phanerochaete sordida]|uniref:Peroxidase family 2 protein n=1 Tax=Phanerochaete sordida TaxID=48140 RepID=A0A9P3LD16_9APHY|nr:peroxidase family 2 protein [Phanerochaete sordida]